MATNNLEDLEVVIGNQHTLTITSDTQANSATCSVVGTNLNVIATLNSTLDAGGLILTVTLPVEVTTAAKHRGTILQIAWDFGNGHIENTRVNLVGVLC